MVWVCRVLKSVEDLTVRSDFITGLKCPCLGLSVIVHVERGQCSQVFIIIQTLATTYALTAEVANALCKSDSLLVLCGCS